MKTPELHLVLWTMILFLLGSGQSSPVPDTLNRPSIVWRGESADRAPKDIERDGGFYSRGEKVQGLSQTQIQDGSSLEQHIIGRTLPFTKFVSTSSEPRMALEFADEFTNGPRSVWYGYLYKIAADWKMIDVEGSLKHRYSGPHRKEQSVVIGIPFNQIMGWYDLKNVDIEWVTKTKEVMELLKRGETLAGFIENKHFDKRYLETRGAGEKPQLAGFDPSDALWNTQPWSEFSERFAPEALKKYIQENYNAQVDHERIWKWALPPRSEALSQSEALSRSEGSDSTGNEKPKGGKEKVAKETVVGKTPRLMGGVFYGPGASILQGEKPNHGSKPGPLIEELLVTEAQTTQPLADKLGKGDATVGYEELEMSNIKTKGKESVKAEAVVEGVQPIKDKAKSLAQPVEDEAGPVKSKAKSLGPLVEDEAGPSKSKDYQERIKDS
ncbi:putative enterotoxin [Ophiocordyceps australis]|uniref:Putative enterotoxin n=1 Tax=Ophiocordyceps australis TaxID=1399860 RepID=A0A2C5ZUD4_9HYPO|nr:putative enterotoxin [Ophiocordyceps australis]